MDIKPEDIIVTIYKGPNDSQGGWSVSQGSAVRVYHKPSGIEVSSDIESSVMKNKVACINEISRRLPPGYSGTLTSKLCTLGMHDHVNCPAVIGEEWYIRLPHAHALVKAIVADVTEHTVELYLTTISASRYKISDIEFVELV